MIELTRTYGRYGYRMITGMLNNSGWHVNHKRVERIWRREGLKVPQKQARKSRLWLNEGACVRLRPEYPNHVWPYDLYLVYLPAANVASCRDPRLAYPVDRLAARATGRAACSVVAVRAVALTAAAGRTFARLPQGRRP